MTQPDVERAKYWAAEADRLLEPVIDTIKKYDDDDVNRHDVLGKLARVRNSINLIQQSLRDKP